MTIDKPEVLKAVIAKLKTALETHARAAGDARDGATDSEVKAENKYDTRSTESSYLARGHAMHFENLLSDIAELEAYPLPAFTEKDTVQKGALVGLSLRGYTDYYIILPKGGGEEVILEDGKTEVCVMTPSAPLFENLKGKKLKSKIRVGDAKFQSTITHLC